MTAVTDLVPDHTYRIARDGPQAIEWWRTDANDLPEARANTLEAKLTWKGGSLTRTVGSGITLATVDGVANAYVILQFTETELAAIPQGAVCEIRWREGTSPNRRTLFINRVEFK